MDPRPGVWPRLLPAAACGGSLPALPCLRQLGPQKSVRELSARAGARRGAGWARPTGSPAQPATPGLPRAQHLTHGPLAGVLRPPLARLALARRPRGRRAGAGDPAGAEPWQAGGEGPAAAPRHVLGQRRQWPLPFAPPGLEQ